MKIAVFEFFTAPGGVTTVLRNVLPNVAMQDHEVIFIDPLPHSFTKNFGVPEVQLPSWPRWTAFSNTGTLVRYARLTIATIGYAIYCIRLAILLRRDKYNILYVHLKKGTYVGSLAAKLAGIPLVVHTHGFKSPRDIKLTHKLALKTAAKIITVSENARKVLLESGIPSKKIATVYNGLDIASWQATANLAVESNERNIIFVGAIQEIKGIDTLINALSRVVSKGISANLIIVGEVPYGGDKDYFTHLNNLISKLDLEKNVKFLGRRDDIPQIMKQADILVLPSKTRSESFGMVIVEAVAAGTLAIGSSCGGIPEVIGDPDLLFQPNNAEELALLITKVLTDAVWSYKKINLLRRHVENNFDITLQVNSLIEIFKSVSK